MSITTLAVTTLPTSLVTVRRRVSVQATGHWTIWTFANTVLCGLVLHTFVSALKKVPALIEAIPTAANGGFTSTAETRPVRGTQTSFSRVLSLTYWLSRNGRSVHLHIAKVLVVRQLVSSLADKSFLSWMPMGKTVSLHMLQPSARGHVHGLPTKRVSKTVVQRN